MRRPAPQVAGAISAKPADETDVSLVFASVSENDITQMFRNNYNVMQVADAILANPADKTEVSLVFANVSEDDIILKDKIDAMAAKHPNFKVGWSSNRIVGCDMA